MDQHYYAIASKATLVKPTELPVPADKFQAAFGISWQDALKSGSVYNALDACKVCGSSSNNTINSADKRSRGREGRREGGKKGGLMNLSYLSLSRARERNSQRDGPLSLLLPPPLPPPLPPSPPPSLSRSLSLSPLPLLLPLPLPLPLPSFE